MDNSFYHILGIMLVCITFGCYFLFWIVLDLLETKKQRKERMRSNHLHHSVLGVWPICLTVLFILLYGKPVPGYLVPLFILLSGLLYYGAGLFDLRRELKQHIPRNTPLTRVALFVPVASTIIGVMGIAFGSPGTFFGVPAHPRPNEGNVNVVIAFVLLIGMLLLTWTIVSKWIKQARLRPRIRREE